MVRRPVGRGVVGARLRPPVRNLPVVKQIIAQLGNGLPSGLHKIKPTGTVLQPLYVGTLVVVIQPLPPFLFNVSHPHPLARRVDALARVVARLFPYRPLGRLQLVLLFGSCKLYAAVNVPLAPPVGRRVPLRYARRLFRLVFVPFVPMSPVPLLYAPFSPSNMTKTPKVRRKTHIFSDNPYEQGVSETVTFYSSDFAHFAKKVRRITENNAYNKCVANRSEFTTHRFGVSETATFYPSDFYLLFQKSDGIAPIVTANTAKRYYYGVPYKKRGRNRLTPVREVYRLVRARHQL